MTLEVELLLYLVEPDSVCEPGRPDGVEEAEGADTVHLRCVLSQVKRHLRRGVTEMFSLALKAQAASYHRA